MACTMPAVAVSCLASYYSPYPSTSCHAGFPDVSAQSIDFYIQWTGGWYTVNGTSASTPTVASIFAMLDDQLVAAGQPPLGWLNPLIYANPQAFNDIVNGQSCSSLSPSSMSLY